MILSALSRAHDPFRRQRPTLTKTPSGVGVVLSHPQAHSLIDASLPDDFFGTDHRFTMKVMDDRPPRLYLRGIPSYLSNEDLLDSIPGVYKVKRLTKIQSRAYVTFTNAKTMALALRDGVTIGKTNLVFEVPHPQACR